MNRQQKSETDLGIFQLKPVGVVRNSSKDPSWGSVLSALDWRDRAARMKEQQKSVSELIINNSLDEMLDGIEEFSHIVVIYWAHLIPSEKHSRIKVHPMGNKDFPQVGIFATGSPIRPNSILITVVRLIERRGNILKVTGLDALDGSPILDIKPYPSDLPDPKDVRVTDWMKKIHEMFREDEASNEER